MTLTCDPTPMNATAVLGSAELTSAQGTLALIAVDIDAHVQGLAGTVTIRQRYRNTRSTALEVTYIFPLPPRAAVTRCEANLAGRRITATLRERQEARMVYAEATAAGKRAALVEEDRPDVFTTTLGNLGPGEQAEITIELTCALCLDGDEACLRLPLVVADRYVDGRPLDGVAVGVGVAPDTDVVPDASRITAPRRGSDEPAAVELNGIVTFERAGLEIAGISSALHSLTETADDERIVVRLAGGEKMDRDLILRVRLAQQPQIAVVAAADDGRPGGDVSVSATLVLAERAERRPVDLAVLLDRSGSMEGWKIVCARRAAARLVDTLGPEDRFWVGGFDFGVEVAPICAGRGLVAATDANRFAAASFLGALEARGGTKMTGAITDAGAALAGADGQREQILVIVTDGQVAGEDDVMRAAASSLAGVRVLAVGIDQACAVGLLQRLAGDAGACEIVESETRLDAVLRRVGRRVVEAPYTNLRIEVDGTEISTAPAGLDGHAGAGAAVYGRVRTDAEVLTVVLTSDQGELARRTVAIGTDQAPRRLWARTVVRELEDSVAVEDDPQRRCELERRVLDVSLGHGVLCRYSAFVAVDEEGAPLTDAATPVVQPLDTVAGWASPGSVGVHGMTHNSVADTQIHSLFAPRTEMRPRGGVISNITAVGEWRNADTHNTWPGVSPGVSPAPVMAHTSPGPDLPETLEALNRKLTRIEVDVAAGRSILDTSAHVAVLELFTYRLQLEVAAGRVPPPLLVALYEVISALRTGGSLDGPLKALRAELTGCAGSTRSSFNRFWSPTP